MMDEYEKLKAQKDDILKNREDEAWKVLVSILEEETDATPLSVSAETNLKNFVRNLVRQ